MESLDLDDSVKREAFLIAKGRQEVADNIKRPEGKFGPYTPLETNWQGAIAEVFLKRMFPSLLLSQPYVVESDETTECDFLFEEEGIEVKCNRFHSIYPVFFINETRFLKKFDHARKVVCCAINDSPSKASKFYIFGWLEAAKVKEYPVETRYSSPAYAVPIEDFLPMDKLFDNPLWHARRDHLNSNQHQGTTRPVHEDLEMSLPLNQVILGDCGDVMAEWPGNSVDCIVTDPPYRIGFMGSSWDRALPPRRAFRQIYRVLKPGALAFIMSSPRQDVLWRMLAMLEGVGFELRQSFISWIYKTGFPKAMDVSKSIDKKLRLKRSKIRYDASEVGNFKGRQDTRPWIEIAKEKGFHETDDDNPVSDEAKRWEGWKSQTGLKPALECILMVNKPRSEPTIVDNVLRWGTGAVNVGACRIPLKGEDISDYRNEGYLDPSKENWRFKRAQRDNTKGRFPANLIISDGALDTGKTTKSGKFKPHHKIAKDENGHSVKNVYGKYRHLPADQQVFYGDEGSPYRYFDLDAWAGHHGFLDVAKPSREERSFGLLDMPKGAPPGSKRSKPAEGRKNPLGEQRANYHPTVKPVKLMAYLIELGCPPKGIVVDPFLGSGTTCIAAKRLRRQWIGIEINPEYAEIAEARINIRGPLDQFMEVESNG